MFAEQMVHTEPSPQVCIMFDLHFYRSGVKAAVAIGFYGIKSETHDLLELTHLHNESKRVVYT